MRKHDKFRKYWDSIGRPKIEAINSRLGNVWTETQHPYWMDDQDYRILGDRHWELRRKWIESDFTLPIEIKTDGGWLLTAGPFNFSDAEYREAIPEINIHIEKPKHNHYFKDVSSIGQIDVYRVLELFDVTNPSIAHAAKKLLCAGQRGSKDLEHDIQDAIDSLIRWQDMRREDAGRGIDTPFRIDLESLVGPDEA